MAEPADKARAVAPEAAGKVTFDRPIETYVTRTSDEVWHMISDLELTELARKRPSYFVEALWASIGICVGLVSSVAESLAAVHAGTAIGWGGMAELALFCAAAATAVVSGLVCSFRSGSASSLEASIRARPRNRVAS